MGHCLAEADHAAEQVFDRAGHGHLAVNLELGYVQDAIRFQGVQGEPDGASAGQFERFGPLQVLYLQAESVQSVCQAGRPGNVRGRSEGGRVGHRDHGPPAQKPDAGRPDHQRMCGAEARVFPVDQVGLDQNPFAVSHGQAGLFQQSGRGCFEQGGFVFGDVGYGNCLMHGPSIVGSGPPHNQKRVANR